MPRRAAGEGGVQGKTCSHQSQFSQGEQETALPGPPQSAGRPAGNNATAAQALAAHWSPGWWWRQQGGHSTRCPLVLGSSSSTNGGTVQPANTGAHTDRPSAEHSWAEENQGLQIATQRPRHRSASPNGPAPIQTRWCPVMSAAPCSVGRPWPVGTGSFLS